MKDYVVTVNVTVAADDPEEAKAIVAKLVEHTNNTIEAVADKDLMITDDSNG